MTELIQQVSVSLSAVITCPPDFVIRVVSIVVAVTTPGDSNTVSVSYRRGASEIAFAMSGGESGNVTKCTFAIGLCQSIPSIDLIDPVTGFVTLNNGTTSVSGGLPDLWCQFDLTLLCSGDLTGEATILYERRPRARARA